MGAGDSLTFWGLAVLVLPGVMSRDWNVWYPENPVCAVRGSTVVIPCAYVYPGRYTVKTFMWCHDNSDCIDTPYVCHSDNINVSSQYRDRAQCLGDKEKNCTLQINNITDSDAGVYRCRFIINKEDGKWTGRSGVTLKVKELKVMVTSSSGKGLLAEGDSVNLTCGSENCSLSQSEFTWFKDNRTTDTLSTLHFNPVAYSHSGNYSCALKGYRGTVSSTVILNIQSDSNLMTVILVCLGILLAVLAVTICIMRRKRDSLNAPNDRGGKKQIPEDNEYVDITESGSQTRSQKQEVPSQGEEVCYASVQFNPKPPDGQCDVSNAESCDGAVVYAAVRKPANCSLTGSHPHHRLHSSSSS